jgi:hypothetical protein
VPPARSREIIVVDVVAGFRVAEGSDEIFYKQRNSVGEQSWTFNLGFKCGFRPA